MLEQKKLELFPDPAGGCSEPAQPSSTSSQHPRATSRPGLCLSAASHGDHGPLTGVSELPRGLGGCHQPGAFHLVYQSMSYYFDDNDMALKNFATYSSQEREHTEKLIKLQNERDGQMFVPSGCQETRT